jgi:hypothetical protein
MLNNPKEFSITDAESQNSNGRQTKKNQYGIQHHHVIRRPILVDVPVETLTAITAYLEPHSLLAVAQVNGHLNQHIKDDNTWRRALFCQFLGLGSEADLDDKEFLLLRRTEQTWRNEFITRYKLRR